MTEAKQDIDGIIKAIDMARLMNAVYRWSHSQRYSK